MDSHQEQINSDINQSENLKIFLLVTFLGFFNAFIPLIVNGVLILLNCETGFQKSLQRQVYDLKAELGTINMVDEFAKYAKIQRKLNKAVDELKNQNDIQTFSRIKLRIAAYVVIYAISVIAMGYLIWNYRSTVLVRVPENLFYPFGFIFSFPTGINGAITITPWAAISCFGAKQIIKIILNN